jgi:hypothetical protein
MPTDDAAASSSARQSDSRAVGLRGHHRGRLDRAHRGPAAPAVIGRRRSSLLPSRYLTVLRQTAQILQLRGIDIDIVDLYAGAAGIGYQRSVLSSLLTADSA